MINPILHEVANIHKELFFQRSELRTKLAEIKAEELKTPGSTKFQSQISQLEKQISEITRQIPSHFRGR